MKRFKGRRISLIISIMISIFWCIHSISAKSYPNKPVTVLIGFKPGGGSDAIAQLAERFLEKELEITFINQYRPGATGAIAWTQLAKQSKPNGYTISVTNTPMLMTNYLINPEIKYNLQEFEPLANVVTDPGIIVVARNSPLETAQDLIDLARENPGRVTIGNSGVGGDDFFTTLIMEKEVGLVFQSIPFQGDGPSWQAAMAGKIDASFNNLAITYSQVKAGNLKPLAIFTRKRSPILPDVPTLVELGYNVVSGSSRGFSAPKGIPTEVREYLIDGFKKIAANPEFQKTAKMNGYELDFIYGDAYSRYLAKQETLYKDIWNSVKKKTRE